MAAGAANREVSRVERRNEQFHRDGSPAESWRDARPGAAIRRNVAMSVRWCEGVNTVVIRGTS
jgi:hypothetical protein